MIKNNLIKKIKLPSSVIHGGKVYIINLCLPLKHCIKAYVMVFAQKSSQ